jgi:hypothetical protein
MNTKEVKNKKFIIQVSQNHEKVEGFEFFVEILESIHPSIKFNGV